MPRDLLTLPMEIAAPINPVTYMMEGTRSLILLDFQRERSPSRVTAVLFAVMIVPNIRVIDNYD